LGIVHLDELGQGPRDLFELFEPASTEARRPHLHRRCLGVVATDSYLDRKTPAALQVCQLRRPRRKRVRGS